MNPTDAQIPLVIAGSPAVAVIAKATVVAAAALLAMRLARRRPAAVRHLTVATSFVVLAALPLASAVVPARDVVVPFLEPAATAAALTPPVLGVTPAAAVPKAAESGAMPGASPTRTMPALPTILLIIWISGAALAIVPVTAGLMRVRRLRQHCRSWRDGERFVARIASELGVGRRIRVLLDDAADGPRMSGVLRPAIVFPAEVRRWPLDALQRASVHEIEHVRRADWLTLCLARLVCAVYWFHPLVWILWRQLRLEAERACDDAVLRSARSADAEAYADQLVTLAERLASNRMHGALP